MNKVILGNASTCGSYLNNQKFPDIAENRTYYWAKDQLFDTDLFIEKTTKKGLYLTDLINSVDDYSIIKDWLGSIIIKRVKVKDVEKYMKDLKEEYLKKGEIKKIREIKSVLSL